MKLTKSGLKEIIREEIRKIKLDHIGEDTKYDSKLNKMKIKFSKPNFNFEWEEAIRYPEFEEMGKQKWLSIANKGKTTLFSTIKKITGNVDLHFNRLEKAKQDRFKSAFETGVIEMPIVVKFSNNEYDLVAGNTRLAGLVKNKIDPKVWVIDISK